MADSGTKICINTVGVLAAAKRISDANNNIDREFEEVASIAKMLEGSWKSPAGSAAATAICGVIKAGEARSAYIRNFAAVLEQQVGEGYKTVETMNTSISDKFL